MSNIINLLPDAVANQIAAGEVIQRPASAVKELLENAVDAGANDIRLIIKDAGKTLIQVIDNGCGMSPTDARMSFERHATSKISKAEDLFRIRSMGFRGEALASIAAIAHVELKTKPMEDELGTLIQVEGSKLVSQSEVMTSSGTIFSIKNLFFNTPARRNFLKSTQVELRHIQEEFVRVALIHPNISFSFYDGDKQKFLLPNSNLKQRIIGIFGKHLKTKLLAVEESTSVVEVSGFVGKPEMARKTRGEQYFFVNNRFIKHPYLNHAVVSAYDELIPEKSFPAYYLHLKVDPENIDVNIHPTKTEVNFKDERAIYSILKAAVKMALGKYALSPQIDFDVEQSLNLNPPPAGTPIKAPEIHYDPDYNPFVSTKAKSASASSSPFSQPEFSEREKSNRANWQNLYEGFNREDEDEKLSSKIEFDNESNVEALKNASYFPWRNQYLLSPMADVLVVIDRQAAHERVLYDRFAALSTKKNSACQRKMFPEMLQFSPADAALLMDLDQEMRALGFDFKSLENNAFEVYGTPPDLSNEILTPIIEGMLDHFKLNRMELKIDKRQNVLLSMAKNLSVRPGRMLSDSENEALIQALFESEMPSVSPSGNQIIIMISPEEMSEKFN